MNRPQTVVIAPRDRRQTTGAGGASGTVWESAAFRPSCVPHACLESEMKTVFAATLIAMTVGLAGCGATIEQKAATGAVAGAVVAGPIGAAVGGAAGTAVGQASKPH